MTTPATLSPVPHRGATTLLTLVAPLVLTATGTALALSWADDLPNPVATHWGADGTPDGFLSLGGALAPFVLTAVVVSVGAWLLAVLVGRSASTRRGAAATAVGTTTLLGVLVVGSLAQQRGLTDAADVPGVEPVVGLAVSAALVLGGLAALLVPSDATHATDVPPPADAVRVPLGASERVAWSATVWSPATLAVAVPVVALQAVLAVVLRTWVLLGVAALLVVLLAAFLVVRVTVDARGLDARSPLGRPRLHVPLDEVVAARAEPVRPLAEFGGWGYRVGRDGRTGFVLRGGDALVVERTGGRTSVVTVDDAATAAGLLNALAARGRSADVTRTGR
ncbi:DUF1648 domain-containing protein [Cellulomonas fimi]|uniref:DUF1648 domain-containing protein n=1 Tax=Cellulomonas fimi (strain ATCC 484 / DSM 20113 / JCM 1341 / CCUG 24087 / LMG 16345 / NBRC 15513 / NCIMB 8980 / NCTC 7547 / NRS-133) TaxID=590998 RepID=F4H5V1_CELFA|nr:DUF1648 domain-containing protein [Cellulomonas fimi]AEE45551.1 hypothetical protein Celf_1416 [Cellulomonas fimi ATCC 484]NNH05937.1 DUF1648 domain-containing protein [Cellulomonas fimi]VEH29829.1 Predicted membrane protein [Cellulomonas fimi]